MSVDQIIQLTGFAVMIILFLYTTKDRRKKSDKEIKLETTASVQNEATQSFQISAILRTVDDHECRIRKTETELVEYKTEQKYIKESLDSINETQKEILDRLPKNKTTY